MPDLRCTPWPGPAVGNDVVDLGDPEALAGASHPRFDQRVFGDGERDVMVRSARPTRLRWMLWAAKEAAYKALRQQDRSLTFHPRKLEVSLLPREAGPLRARVRYAGREVWVRIAVAGGRVHAVAGQLGCAASARLRPGETPSAGARRLALAVAGRCFPGEALRIESEDGIPLLIRMPGHDGPCSRRVPLSLSHHGRFVACAVSGASA